MKTAMKCSGTLLNPRWLFRYCWNNLLEAHAQLSVRASVMWERECLPRCGYDIFVGACTYTYYVFGHIPFRVSQWCNG